MEKQRAYSFLNIKAINEEERVFRGMATTPEVDRMGDVVDPMGAKFRNPLPLLWMHIHSQPVGEVKFGKPTKDGIPFEAKIVDVPGPTGLKARVDEAWQSVKSGLIKAVSIGFRAIEWSINEDSGGYNFLKTDIYELSLVSVPANAGATIQEIKSFDDKARLAASGNEDGKTSEKVSPSGVTEKKNKPVKRMKPKEGNKMDPKEEIKQYQATRAAKVAEMQAIMKTATDAGETLDESQSDAYDALENEISAIDKHLKRLETMQKVNQSVVKAIGAQPVQGDDEANATQSRNPTVAATVKVKPTQEKGIAFARLARSIGLAKGNYVQALQIAQNRYQDDPRIINILKDAVSAGTTSGGTWAAPLVGDESTVFADFAEFLRPMTILGKFGAGGVPALRRVPFRTRLLSQDSGGAGYWVGEGAAKPVTNFDFAGTTLDPLKVANIAVVTMELLRDSSPSAEAIIRDQLAAALKERMDIDFIDPEKTDAPGISPASITNGVTPITSSGNDADGVRNDIRQLFNTFIAANNAPTNGVWIMSSVTALALSLMQNPLGQVEFPGLGMTGGTLFGLPVITSQYVPTDSAGGYVFLVNASDIYFGDEGGVSVDMSDQASLQMLDNPTNNSATPTPTTTVSLWQTNSIGFRAERTLNWKKRRATAVAVLDGVNWGVSNS